MARRPARARRPRVPTKEPVVARNVESGIKGADPLDGDGRSNIPNFNGDAKSNKKKAGDSSDAKSKSMFESATAFIKQAASLLDKEVEAGIDAAKNLEKRFVDVKSVRERNSDEVMERLSKHGHDVVDLLVGLLEIAVHSVDGFTKRVIRIKTSGAQESDVKPPNVGTVPTLSPLSSAKRGETVELDMALENSADTAVEVPSFDMSDLMSSSGARISAEDVSFSPKSVVIAPRGKASVTICVRIGDIPPGNYSGLMSARNLERVQAILLIRVD